MDSKEASNYRERLESGVVEGERLKFFGLLGNDIFTRTSNDCEASLRYNISSEKEN